MIRDSWCGKVALRPHIAERAAALCMEHVARYRYFSLPPDRPRHRLRQKYPKMHAAGLLMAARRVRVANGATAVANISG